MPTDPTSQALAKSDMAEPIATQRTTGKLLATQGYVVGVEISGSGSRQTVALADLNGNILHRVRRPLAHVMDTQSVLNLLDEMLQEVTSPQKIRDGRILRVGVAVGGLVDARHGIVRRLHHAHGWDNFPLQDYFAEKLAVPCIIDNNANAAALAEVVRGVAQAERLVLYVGLGRGIGGGMVLNGKIFHGTTGTAGEIGHLLVKEEGPKCSCGGHGHLEAIASAQAIVRTMIGRAIEHPASEAALLQITDGRAERVTIEQIYQMAVAGNAIAQQVVSDVHTYLGIALANIVHLLNPGMIVIGGTVAQAAGDLLVVPLRERMRQFCLPEARASLSIVTGKLGSEANLLGAVTLALQDI